EQVDVDGMVAPLVPLSARAARQVAWALRVKTHHVVTVRLVGVPDIARGDMKRKSVGKRVIEERADRAPPLRLVVTRLLITGRDGCHLIDIVVRHYEVSLVAEAQALIVVSQRELGGVRDPPGDARRDVDVPVVAEGPESIPVGIIDDQPVKEMIVAGNRAGGVRREIESRLVADTDPVTGVAGPRGRQLVERLYLRLLGDQVDEAAGLLLTVDDRRRPAHHVD